MRERRVIICGGGTGGHTFPALAVGRRLKAVLPSAEVTYVGTGRAVERRIMDEAGQPLIALRIEGLKGKGWGALRSALLLPRAFLQAFRLLRRVDPDLVIGVGGYSSGPVVLLASLMRKSTLILEQNVRPGFTNRRLLPWVDKAVVAFERSLTYFKGKGVFLGNPVREEFYSTAPRKERVPFTLLVFGGSQGAHILNRSMVEALPYLEGQKHRLRIFHQTGLADLDLVREAYARAGFGEAEAFTFDMPAKFQASDLVISRAGATTVAELIAAGKASILVPFGRAAAGHQMENARALEEVQAAEVLPEEKLSARVLAERILHYLDHPSHVSRMEANLAPLQTKDAAAGIAALCLELMGHEVNGGQGG